MPQEPARSGKTRARRAPTGRSARIFPYRKLFTEAPKKDPPPIPRASGIYFIVCKATGQFYVGSAVDLHARRRSHWTALRCRTHANKYLQQAWNRHGEANFDFKVVELVRPSRLLATEQSWLNKTSCNNRSIGFNISPHALSSGSLAARTWRGFFDPQGRPVTIKNLARFCRQSGLDSASMIRLFQGRSKLKSYKGWTHRNSVRIRDYVKTHSGFINPEGRLVRKITNLAAFCREKKLDKTHMVAVAHRRIVSHRGWTHKDGRELLTPKKHTGFIRPDGRRAVIINLSRFCRENGLQVVRMHNLKSGIRRIHKGWTWNPE